MPRLPGVWAAALAAAVVVAVPPSTARAADRAAAPVRIEAVDVEQVPRLAPGVPLLFTVTGTARAAASLAVEGLAREVPMREVEPGVYEATLTLHERDGLAADARVVAVLRDGDRVARAPLREALVLGAAERADAGDTAWAAAGPVRAGRPVPTGPAALEDVRVARAPSTESIGRPPGLPVPTARGGADAPDARDRAPERARVVACGDCAVVESIVAVEGDDAPQRAGAFASTVTGSVLGERFGEAHGRRITKIWNVLSGRSPDAVAAPGWDVVLRSPDGRTVQRRYAERPVFDVGDTVRLAAGSVAPPREEPWR